jgi:hypothetical protein
VNSGRSFLREAQMEKVNAKNQRRRAAVMLWMFSDCLLWGKIKSKHLEFNGKNKLILFFCVVFGFESQASCGDTFFVFVFFCIFFFFVFFAFFILYYLYYLCFESQTSCGDACVVFVFCFVLYIFVLFLFVFCIFHHNSGVAIFNACLLHNLPDNPSKEIEHAFEIMLFPNKESVSFCCASAAQKEEWVRELTLLIDKSLQDASRKLKQSSSSSIPQQKVEKTVFCLCWCGSL